MKKEVKGSCGHIIKGFYSLDFNEENEFVYTSLSCPICEKQGVDEK